MSIDFDNFETIFRPSIRTAVNWRALREMKCKVDTHVIETRDQLGRIQIPWYSNGDLHARKRRRVKVLDAATLQHSDLSHRKEILDLASGMCTARQSAMLLPAVSIAGYVLLDGAHRSIATYLSGVDFRIVLKVLWVSPEGKAAIFDL